MCGIVAAILLDKQAKLKNKEEAAKLGAKLTGRLMHRGPDDMGVHVGENFWMGHTRLSIVDPKNGHQPLTDQSKTSFVVANGEIYNHKALKEELRIGDEELVTHSDSEVIIHAYKKIGNEVCTKLIGMFGFVLVTEDGDVLACRDKIGIKPLYMGKSKDGTEMFFASELKAIVDQCTPDDLMLVPAGHYWTRETGLVDYYQPEWDVENYSAQFQTADNQVESLSEKSDSEESTPKRFATAEECKKSLEEAVILRCMADVEVGLLLSGGLDSSILGAIMVQPHVRKHLTATKKLKSFAVGQEGSPDIIAARCVAEQLGTDHIEAIFTPEMAFEILENVVYHAETYEPELLRSCIPNYFLAKKTAEHVKVVLTGEGSDELWSGYLYYNDCKDAMTLQNENRRILKAVQVANLQRCDRMAMAHSLEARVPFFDVNNLAVSMRVDPAKKLIKKGADKSEDQFCEKWMLRKMYEDIVAPEVVWRTKAMQCEGVGMTWVKALQNHISTNLVTDEQFAKADSLFPKNPPQTKEEYYYRTIFEKYYPGCEKFVHVWPGGCRAGGAPWKNEQYTRAGLVNTEMLKKGHGLADKINV